MLPTSARGLQSSINARCGSSAQRSSFYFGKAAVAGTGIAQRSILRAAPVFTELLPLARCKRKLARCLQIRSRRPALWASVRVCRFQQPSTSSATRKGPMRPGRRRNERPPPPSHNPPAQISAGKLSAGAGRRRAATSPRNSAPVVPCEACTTPRRLPRQTEEHGRS